MTAVVDLSAGEAFSLGLPPVLTEDRRGAGAEAVAPRPAWRVRWSPKISVARFAAWTR